jgi:hypothetical protein
MTNRANFLLPKIMKKSWFLKPKSHKKYLLLCSISTDYVYEIDSYPQISLFSDPYPFVNSMYKCQVYIETKHYVANIEPLQS